VGEQSESCGRGPRERFVRLWPSAGPSGRPEVVAALLGEYEFLRRGGIDDACLRAACEEGAARSIPPHLLLIHSGSLATERYLAEIEAWLAVSGGEAAGAGVTEVVDALSSTPAGVALATARVRQRGNVPILLMPQHIDWSEPLEARQRRAEQAASGLRRERPEMSAGSPFATWQLLVLSALPGLAIGGLAMAPEVTAAVVAGVVALPFLMIVGLRLLALAILLLPDRRQRLPGALPDAALPVYSVIVPLFREAEVVPGLVEALCRLDYPSPKLDILIVTEAVDEETQAALRDQVLPPHFRVLVVPDLQPRTKPKALNYALRLARGSYVVVYDAEDEPEPDQLRRAQRMFRDGPANLMCVQGRLVMRAAQPGWMGRQFELEYAALFDGLLPALVRLGLPVPLGGTSNHFPRDALERLGGWDAWNVTEDADLGIRIARLGGEVRVLDSSTHEEPPDRLGVWIPQRTRWLKGFMQTWLVHMRDPRRLLDELGFRGFVAFNAFLGGIVLSALVHPVFVALLVWEAARGTLLVVPETPLGSFLYGLALFNLAGGYLSGMAIAGVAAVRRRRWGLLAHLPLMPLYWLLISAAAYRAAVQLVTRPYLWEKTPHKPRAGAGRT
jgi:cellulose synthase/poly-beta-1,6-N-acetylglucosamine synthase-like glycosyltransferase